MTKQKGPQFLQYAIPILDILKELGGSAKPSEIIDKVIDKLKISEKEQNEVNQNGQSRVKNQIAWARFYLAKDGLLDSSRRGVWSLTDKGRNAKLDPEEVYILFKRVHTQFEKNSNKNEVESIPDETESIKIESYKIELLQVLQNLSADGFERICQRLLRESGFEQVVVTGRSGDGGIDGHGILQINPVVSFKVLFQCKRYTGTVSPSQVRDFRGAMAGRADKGIIMTTGSFSSEARKEAVRDGVPAIELVDGDKLVKMFEACELGLIPRKTFDIDEAFFKEFKS
ncbi:MAG TPA: restriction endonuclease [Lentisphaeria bacterium]|nr:MAG: restriction endonuclease [Lentisphaerae bacterium GWF2_49_21]HBC89057.1 restriction endonuclease [Lentisphaeria bacterium]